MSRLDWQKPVVEPDYDGGDEKLVEQNNRNNVIDPLCPEVYFDGKSFLSTVECF